MATNSIVGTLSSSVRTTEGSPNVGTLGSSVRKTSKKTKPIPEGGGVFYCPPVLGGRKLRIRESRAKLA